MNYFACILPNFWSNGAPRLCLQCQFSPELYTLDTDFAVDRSRWSTRCPKCPCTWGSVGRMIATQDVSVRHALPGLIFYFFDFFIVLKVCVKTFISKFSISKSFVWSFLAPKFVLLQNYAPPSSFQNLSISKYSSPIFFTKFFCLEFSS